MSTIEPGLDLHEWETRWEELLELADDSPEEALPEIVRHVELMVREAGYDLESPVVREGEEDVVRDFLAARDVAEAVERGGAEGEDVETALENLREIHEVVAKQRAR